VPRPVSGPRLYVPMEPVRGHTDRHCRRPTLQDHEGAVAGTEPGRTRGGSPHFKWLLGRLYFSDRSRLAVPGRILYLRRVSIQSESPIAGLPPIVKQALKAAKVDFAPAHEQPAWGLLFVATVISVAGSLVADAILVKLGTAIFPSTAGFVHFRFSDYAKLTIIGVIIACAGWPVVTRVSSAPRWLFLRAAVAVTLVLWLPDLYIFVKGEPFRDVAVLMVMHLAIALVTYNALIRFAPARRFSG
jgi:hypothetical protein